ncbi:MAG: peroxiredoxin [Pseudomonadota bacterium]
MKFRDNLGRIGLCGAVWLLISFLTAPVGAQTDPGRSSDPGTLKPTESKRVLNPGDPAPDFTLPSTAGGTVTLSHYFGWKNVVISFVPAAWTPVCSKQWPGYNIAKEYFDKYDAVIIGITVDNVPTLQAWTSQWGKVWFPVLSDFWPHGATAQKYGVLRSDGVTERALFVVDKKGVIRFIDVHDIGKLPKLEDLMKELEKLPKP